ncbi:hypothetical protein ABZP36_020023 [Zizania latifolia]
MGRKKEAEALPPQAVGGEEGGVNFTTMPEEELVNFWEDLIDYDKEAARELFWEALTRDAVGSAEHKQQKAAATAEEDGDGGRHPLTRFFQQPSTSNTPRAAPPPPTPDARTVVLCLCAPAAPPLAADRRKRPRAAPATVPTRKKPA